LCASFQFLDHSFIFTDQIVPYTNLCASCGSHVSGIKLMLGALSEQVFPMLGVFYSVVGLLQLVLDNWLAPKERKLTASLDRVGLSFL
jgi:hypothetical protein